MKNTFNWHVLSLGSVLLDANTEEVGKYSNKWTNKYHLFLRTNKQISEQFAELYNSINEQRSRPALVSESNNFRCMQKLLIEQFGEMIISMILYINVLLLGMIWSSWEQSNFGVITTWIPKKILQIPSSFGTSFEMSGVMVPLNTSKTFSRQNECPL